MRADGPPRLPRLRDCGPDYRPYVARPLGAELLTRPDMQAYPPDMLITNYSMLNVMLNRPDEAGDLRADGDIPRTRRRRVPPRRRRASQLQGHSRHRGRDAAAAPAAPARLAPESPKLRVIAASASLGDDEEAARAYLEEFFAVPRASFRLLRGEAARLRPRRRRPAARRALRAARAARARRARRRGATRQTWSPPRSATPAAFAGEHRLTRHLPQRGARCGRGDDGRARVAAALAARLLPDAPADSAREALAGAPRGARAPAGASGRRERRAAAGARASLLPHRSRLVGLRPRRLPGRRRAVPRSRAPRTVGKLYAEPTIRCECGARCLDLWACQTCGDHLLGGYVSDDGAGGVVSAARAARPRERPRLQRQPTAPTSATASSGPSRRLRREPMRVNWESAPVALRWIRASSDAIRLVASKPTEAPTRTAGCSRCGWGRKKSQTIRLADVPAIPTRCPNCNDDREVQRLGTGSQARVARGHVHAIGCARRSRAHERRTTASRRSSPSICCARLYPDGSDATPRRLLRLPPGRGAAERVSRRLAPSRRGPPARRPLPVAGAGSRRGDAPVQALPRRSRWKPGAAGARSSDVLRRSEAAQALRARIRPLRDRGGEGARRRARGAGARRRRADRRRPRLRLHRAAARRPQPGRAVVEARATSGWSCSTGRRRRRERDQPGDERVGEMRAGMLTPGRYCAVLRQRP